MRRLICNIFGHQPPTCGRKGWWSPGEEYAKVRLDGRDGIGREHAAVIGECPRCGVIYRVCRIHVPEIGKKGATL